MLPLISFEEVQRHNEEGDVWMVIAGKACDHSLSPEHYGTALQSSTLLICVWEVYDFTDFTKGKDGGHPGGKGDIGK